MIDFKGSHFEKEIIWWGVRWYVASPISYRQVEEMRQERGSNSRSREKRWRRGRERGKASDRRRRPGPFALILSRFACSEPPAHRLGRSCGQAIAHAAVRLGARPEEHTE